jgi:biotin synthase
LHFKQHFEMIEQLLNKEYFTSDEIVALLKAERNDKQLLFEKSHAVKTAHVQNKVYFRGLIEFSNICKKDCLYCGIRKSNQAIKRFNLTDDEILDAARFAYENRYGSVVLQSGELESKQFTKRITSLLDKIMKLSNNKLRVTLSCGEQSLETYRQWFEHGATRYLLRIETTNRELYYKLHPNNKEHDYESRLQCLEYLRTVGYQLGTGVMIGLPFQTYEHLADDLLWMKAMDVDMVGMGPYLEHEGTPMYEHRHLLLPLNDRFELALKMVAVLRIMMKDINIAAATALQSIDKLGREKAIKIGANVIMPNITPGMYRDSYKLYDNKPCTDESPEDCQACLELRIALADNEIAYDEWGDSRHFTNKGLNKKLGTN